MKANYSDYAKYEATRAKRDELAKTRQKKLDDRSKAALAEKKAEIQKKEKELDLLNIKLIATNKALEDAKTKAKTEKRAIYGSIDGKLLKVGGRYRNFRGTHQKQAGATIDIGEGSAHITGLLNGIPVGLCGSLRPITVTVGEIGYGSPDGDTDAINVSGNAMGCAEIGLGQHAMLRDTATLEMGFSKGSTLFTNTVGADVGNHLNFGWSYENERNGEHVSKNLFGVKGVF